MKPTPRLRGRKLQVRRARWFARWPLCVECEKAGKVRQATELDHILPLFKGGRDDGSNLQGLCETCHKAKTAIDLGSMQKKRIGLDGFPVEDGPARGGGESQDF